MLPNPQPSAPARLTWQELTPAQQQRLTHLLGRLLCQYLATQQRPSQKEPEEVKDEQPT